MKLIPDGYFHDPRYLSVPDSITWFEFICKHNQIDPAEFFDKLCTVIDKKEMKRNAVILESEPNAGKSLIMNSVAESCVYYAAINNFTGKSSFEFAELMNQRVGLVNEPCVTDLTVETLKLIFEGAPTSIDVKYKSSNVLQRVPLLVTTNQNFVFYTTAQTTNKAAFAARSYHYRMYTCPDLVHCKGALHPMMWKKLYEDRFC